MTVITIMIQVKWQRRLESSGFDLKKKKKCPRQTASRHFLILEAIFIFVKIGEELKIDQCLRALRMFLMTCAGEVSISLRCYQKSVELITLNDMYVIMSFNHDLFDLYERTLCNHFTFNNSFLTSITGAGDASTHLKDEIKHSTARDGTAAENLNNPEEPLNDARLS